MSEVGDSPTPTAEEQYRAWLVLWCLVPFVGIVIAWLIWFARGLVLEEEPQSGLIYNLFAWRLGAEHLVAGVVMVLFLLLKATADEAYRICPDWPRRPPAA